MTLMRRAVYAALLLLAAPLHASQEGRIIVTVLEDGSNAPVEGAKVVLSRPETTYKLEKTTDKKGQAQILVLDATQNYLIRAEKAGYNPFEGPVKPKLSDTLRLTFVLTKAQTVDPNAPKELTGTDKAILAYNDGVEKLKAGDLAGAVPRFEEAVKENPSLAEANGALAEVYLELKNYGEALATSDRFLALKPGDVRGLRDRYDALKGLGEGEKERATAALEALRVADPGSAETAVRLFNEGAERTRSGQYDEAAVFFERVVEVAPEDPKFAKAHYVLGLSYAKDEAKKAVARQHLETFLRLAPTDSDAETAKQMLDYLK